MNKKLLFIIIVIFSILGITAIFTINPQIHFDKLNISEDEWNTIVSSRSEGELFLKSIKFNDYDLIIDDDSNKIYYSVIKNSSNKFSPLVSYTASSSNAKIAFLNDEINENKISNNHEFKMIVYDDKEYSIYGLYCTNFPMLNIVLDEEKIKKSGTSMSMYLFNNFDNGIQRIVRSDGNINIVETEDNVNNYKFSLVMTTPGNNERDNVISLLHMKQSNEYYLNAINIGENTSPLKPILEKKDRASKSDSNNSTSGDMMFKLKERDEQRVELFINNQYVGLYSLTNNPNIKLDDRNK